jgi:transposase
MKFVATKTADQLDLQALHPVRERLVSQRTGIIDQIRAFSLERGIAVRQGLRFLRAQLAEVLGKRTDVLSDRMVHVIEGLAADWHRLDERIQGLSGEIQSVGQSGSRMQAVDDGARHWTDHLQRDGRRDRQRHGVLQRA